MLVRLSHAVAAFRLDQTPVRTEAGRLMAAEQQRVDRGTLILVRLPLSLRIIAFREQGSDGH